MDLEKLLAERKVFEEAFTAATDEAVQTVLFDALMKNLDEIQALLDLPPSKSQNKRFKRLRRK